MQNTKSRKISFFVIACLATFVLGLIVLYTQRSRFTTLCFLFLSLLTAPAFGIAACARSFKRQKLEYRILLGMLIFILATIVLFHGRFFLGASLPLIYTPPALDSENLGVYNKCITFLKNHEDYKNIAVLRRGMVIVNPDTYDVATYPAEFFPAHNVAEMKSLLQKLRRIFCQRFQRTGDMILFYRSPVPFTPLYPEEIFSLYPRGPGVLYSLSGENPNEVDNDVLNVAKPFVKIYGNWYMSRKLELAGPRGDIHGTTPEGWIDHSLYIDGINPNELHRFD